MWELAWIRRTCSRRAMTFKSEAGVEKTLEQIDRTIGLENVPVIHVNDSKIPLGGTSGPAREYWAKEKLAKRRSRGFCSIRD